MIHRQMPDSQAVMGSDTRLLAIGLAIEALLGPLPAPIV